MHRTSYCIVQYRCDLRHYDVGQAYEIICHDIRCRMLSSSAISYVLSHTQVLCIISYAISHKISHMMFHLIQILGSKWPALSLNDQCFICRLVFRLLHHWHPASAPTATRFNSYALLPHPAQAGQPHNIRPALTFFLGLLGCNPGRQC